MVAHFSHCFPERGGGYIAPKHACFVFFETEEKTLILETEAPQIEMETQQMR